MADSQQLDDETVPPVQDYAVDPTGSGDEVPEINSVQDLQPEQHPELENLALQMAATDAGTKQLEEIGALCFEQYQEDEGSRKEWLDQQAKYIKLAAQTDRPLNPPWPGSSEESLPILAEARNQSHARIMRACFGSRDIIKAIPINLTNPDVLDRSMRVGRHMSFQLMVQDRKYYRDKDRMFASLPVHGSFFTKTYRDPLNKRNVVENVRAIDFVAPYGSGPRDVEDLDRKTHVIYMDANKGRYLFKQKYFIAAPEPFELNDDNAAGAAADQISGVHPTESAMVSGQCRLLEQHRYLDLDQDGLEEPYIVTIDAQNQTVLRISARWEMFSEDQYIDNGVDQATGQPNRQLVNRRGDPTNYKRPVEYFTHYVYLENPDGFYGLGLGYLVGSTNTAVNKMLRQIIDAATLQTTTTGFISKRLGLKKGPMEIEMGRLNPIDATADEIRNQIYMLEFKPPSAAMAQMLELLTSRADRLAGSTEVLTGAPDKVMQPTTVAALIEQGLMTYTAVQNRIVHAWEIELDKLYKLNAKYLDDVEYFAVNDVTGPQQLQIGNKDYASDLQIRAAVDPNQSTDQQRMARAEKEFQTLMNLPRVQQDAHLQWSVVTNYLKQLGSTDIEKIFPPPPPAPPPGMGPPPPPDPKMIETQGLLAIDNQRMQGELAIKAQKAQGELSIRAAEAASRANGSL